MMQILACRDRSDMGYVGFLIGSEAMTDALFLLDTDHDDVPVNSDELNAGWRLTLPSSVRKHAIQAMRLKDGDELQLSDGRGLRIHAVLRDAQQGIAEVLRFRQGARSRSPGSRWCRLSPKPAMTSRRSIWPRRSASIR